MSPAEGYKKGGKKLFISKILWELDLSYIAQYLELGRDYHNEQS